ncbi:MAG: GNAT family N-acetyltransferase [Pseudomonadota bacterium]
MEHVRQLPLQQHPDFGAALKKLGTDVRRVDIDGAAPTQVIKRFGCAFASRGPIWERENPGALRRSPLRIINAEQPSDIYRSAGFPQFMTPAHVAELSLREIDWMVRAHGKWRNAWRKSEKSRLALDHTHFNVARHAWLLKEDRAHQRRKKFRALPQSIIHAYAALHPDNVRVFTAHRKEETLAAMLFLQHGQVATYHLGWSSTQGRETNAHYALLKKAVDIFRARGVIRLDLGTVDTDNAPGLARFKIGSGAQIRPLGGTWLRASKRPMVYTLSNKLF